MKTLKTKAKRKSVDPSDEIDDPAFWKLVNTVARIKNRTLGLDEDEAISTANLAVAEALDSFDVQGGASFRTWVVFLIRRRLIDAKRETMPSGWRRKDTKANRDVQPMPSIVSIDHNYLRTRNQPNSGSVASKTLADQLADDAPPVGWELEHEDEVNALIRRYPTKGPIVAALYLEAGMNLAKIAEAHDLVESRVSQIHREVFGRLWTAPKKASRKESA